MVTYFETKNHNSECMFESLIIYSIESHKIVLLSISINYIRCGSHVFIRVKFITHKNNQSKIIRLKKMIVD